MNIDDIDNDIDNDIDDDSTDGQDRGDVLPSEDKTPLPSEDKGQPRGKDGKFAKADAGADEDDEDDGEESEDEDTDAEEEDDEGDDEGDAGGKKVDNAAVRLDKMRSQRDKSREEAAALKARIAELEGSTAKPEPKPDPIAALDTEIDSLYEQVEEARLDGDVKTAAKLQRQLDAKKEEKLELKAEQIASRTTSEASENSRYDALLDKLESEIPVLNPRHDDFDPKAVQALEFYVEAHEKMGMSPSRALTAAANIVFGAPAKHEEKAPEPKKPDPKVVELKRKTDVNKSLDTQKRQPPDASGRGVDKDDTTLNPDDISDEEWEKLPDSKRKQMRGDFG